MLEAQAQAEVSSPPIALIEVDEFEIRNFEAEQYDRDPRLPRWGYNPGLKGCHIPSTRTGLKVDEIPVGKFIPFRSFPSKRENFTLDIYAAREVEFTVHAHAAELEVKIPLDAAGYQGLFFGITDIALVRTIEKTVLPTLPEIRTMFGADSPVGQFCKGEDALDGGESRDYCATCHLAWIKSDACTAFIAEVTANGMSVSAAGFESRIVKPSAEMFFEARRAVQSGLEKYIKFAAEQWATVVGEFKDKKRSQLHRGEHLMRKDLHEYEPDRSDVRLVDRLADGLTRPAQIPAPAGVDPTMLAFMERSEQRAAEAEARTLEILSKLADKIAPAPEVTPPRSKTKQGETQ
jgi:hypothetical protein